MKISQLLTLVWLGAMMTGCLTQTVSHTETTNIYATGDNTTYNRTTIILPNSQPYYHTAPAWFGCANGLRVQARHINQNELAISVYANHQTAHATLRLVASPNGNRYVGNVGIWGNSEWYERGGRANFSYRGGYGNATQRTVCSM